MSESGPIETDDAAAVQRSPGITWAGAVAAAILVGATAVGLWFVLAPWEAVFVYVFGPAVFALVLLNTRFPRLGAFAGRLFGAYWRFTFWFAVALAPALGARLLSDLVAGASLGVALAVLLIWVAVYLLLVLQVSSERRRKVFWTRARRLDRVTPFVYTFSVAFVAIILFATLAFILSDRGAIEFAAGSRIAEPSNAADFFLWHLLDSIPALDVNETLRWEQPLSYTDGGVGALLLAFKLVVIVPIVAAFVAFWKYNRDGIDPKPAVAAQPPAGT